MNTLVYEVISHIAQMMGEKKAYLTDLDREIGDGDHGINMARGFEAVMKKLEKNEEVTVGALFKKVGMTLLSTVGGASGPLYGSAFLKAAIVTKDIHEVDRDILQKILEAALEGIQERGKATLGDKTIIDALEPAHKAFLEAYNKGMDAIVCMDAACEAAEKGVEYTKTIAARKGRASYLGDRSIGHQDPGATSVTFMLQAIRDVIKEKV